MPCSASVTEERLDLRVLREPAFPLLREEQRSVGQHVELPIAARLDLGSVLGLGVQLGRETRGPIVVAISDGAVLDQDVGHGMNATSGAAAPGSWRMRRLSRSVPRGLMLGTPALVPLCLLDYGCSRARSSWAARADALSLWF
jgi:hypothetical protein